MLGRQQAMIGSLHILVFLVLVVILVLLLLLTEHCNSYVLCMISSQHRIIIDQEKDIEL